MFDPDLCRLFQVDWSRWVEEEDLQDEDDEIDEDDVKVWPFTLNV